MKKIDAIIVSIDDDIKIWGDAFFDDIEDDVNDIKKFGKPSEGLDYIKKNIDKKMIVILDWKFGQGMKQGSEVLNEISTISQLVPVIICTGQNIDAEEANKMFAGNAFSCLPKTATLDQMSAAVESAYDRIKNDIRTVMEEWILMQSEERRKKPYVRTAGKDYTLNDILMSIRKQDDFGKETAKGILSLATELFLNKGEEQE